jgi:hypothetical protein
VETKSNGNGSTATLPEIILGEGHITFVEPFTVFAPTAAAALEKRAPDRRPDKIGEFLERGARMEADSELSLAVEHVGHELSNFSKRFSHKVKTEFIEQLRAIVTETDASQKLFFNRYADPQNAASLPGATARAVTESNATMIKQIRAIFEAEDGPWGKAIIAITKEMREANMQMVQQMAARKALVTRSNLSGRPWEDALEAWLMARSRVVGDLVERTTNASGQANRLTGDFVITVNPDETAGVTVKVAVEGKRRSRQIGIKQIVEELKLVKRNRAALAGVFAVPCADLLPGGEPFLDIAPGWFAVAYDAEAGDDLALTLALRSARATAISTSKPATAGMPDLDAANRYIAEIRKAMVYREDIRRHHAAAVNGIGHASAAVDKIVNTVLEAVGKLEETLK